jgi:nucleoside phosphorylase
LTYFHYELSGRGNKIIKVSLACLTQIGPAPAAAATTTIVDLLKPTHFVLVGIAGTVAWPKLGDVVVADHVVHFDTRREETPSGPRYAPCGFPVDRQLLSRAQAFQSDDDLLAAWKAKNGRRIDGREWAPDLHTGTIATNDAVINDPRTKEILTSSNRRIIATEMEGGGVLEAAVNLDGVRVMVVRGISDGAANKAATDAHTNWRQISIEAAASFTLAFIQQFADAGAAVPTPKNNNNPPELPPSAPA